ncbi:Protein RALF-like 31 [Cardamine amara subsp. amara]|uniref:Protein RALF-like 31 n=1 Tax=Cardamine amara subsp. amara TaxID=228776 RepID=A0ABD1BR18_CARAN
MLNSVALVFFTILFLQSHLFISDAIPISSTNGEIDAMLVRNSLIGEDEELMPSEISRRVLMTQKRYIGYETLKRDMVPCQKPGASYYDCRSGQANSYSRGCDSITRCARDTSDINS